MRRTEIPPEQQAIRDRCFHPSGTFVEFPIEDVETSIPARFEKIVRSYPNNLAVKMGQRSLTYEELNRYANRIARAIVEKRGLGSEPIGLFFAHSADLVAAIFGVLKAGKFYVVLDPSFPPERLQFLLKDSGAKLVITDQFDPNIALEAINQEQALITTQIDDETHSSDDIKLSISPQEIACIQYTSGSTGTPKGVVVPHRMILKSAQGSSKELHVCVEDRFTLLHSLSFGSGHVNLRLALLNGASIFDFDPKRQNIEQIAAWLKDERITIYHSSTSLFRQIAESLPYGGMHPDLRLIRLSGGPISKRDFDLYKTRFGSNTLLRIAMGSTEGGAISICAAILNQDFSYPSEGSPIGYPSRGRTILFLDQDRRPVARGQIGEIAVKSENLSGGYWKQASATHDKFLPDPNGGDERIYLTGDLGRMLPDGFVIHLGRKDLMVKIRGYRVDFSEVERALLKHPAIKDAGVRSWDREDGEKYLVAYIVLRPDSQLNVSEIRQFLSSKLPDYMIPMTVQFVEALPLTNDKLDRQELPKPDTLRPALKETYVSPRNETEKKLAGIWSEVLGIAEIGVHDNFFDLGGHSLTVSRIVARVLDCFQVEVSLRSIFESPTLAGVARNVENALCQRPSETNLSLVPVRRDNTLPASFGQQALWFHHQIDPGSCAYNLLSSYRLSGELDAQMLEQSINQLIARHEILRTIFEAVDGQPAQNILPVVTIGLEVVDLSNLVSGSLHDSEVHRFATGLACKPFDLTRGPLLRAALLRLANNEYVFLLAVHHIVFDGWSIGVFCRELSQIYNSLRNGETCPFPELSIQYADFAKWQRQRLRDANLESSLSYWKNRLGSLPALRLPGSRSQFSADRASSGREEFAVSDELLRGLQRLTDCSGTTLFMVLLAAWKVVLYRYTGQTDIAIGTAVAGRNHPAVEGLIGYFLNLVVLRSDLSGDPTFRELLERIRRVCIDAFEHQDLPFEKLIEELRPTRHGINNPLVQATFALQNTPKQPLNLAGIAARDLDISAEVARPFDLHLYVIEEETCLRGYVSYNKNLFEADPIRRLISHLTNLLKAIAADPNERISALPMLSEQERHQLLVDWNNTKNDFLKDKCIHQLFEEQVERTPDGIAVVFENQQLTYRELNERANQLAHYLCKQGVGPEVLVGICMGRSPEMIIGLLGVLKAGGAYVPLDPNYPAERLQFILNDAQVRLMLTNEGMVEDRGLSMKDSEPRASNLDPRIRQICLGRNWSMIATENDTNLENTATQNDLAYVIYTSGSTGQPKGVQITHQSLLNLVFWHQQTFSVTPIDRATQLAGIGFDAMAWELWPYLTIGATVHIPDNTTRLDAAALRGWLVAQAITISFVSTALAESLIVLDWPRATALRILLTGGDVLRVYPPDGLPFRIFNNYGPTECTVVTTSAEIWPNAYPLAPPTIGRPIANSRVYILDVQRNPVPIGVVGEIYIGGDGVARGYWNRPKLTAENFIYHSFSGEVAQRLYKTGDLARYLADGNIEFLGRIDNQVKIRGYRIELSEIEVVLAQHPTIQQAAVIVREDELDDVRLVGYVIVRSGESFDAAEVRRYLKQKLPDYMIPFALVVLDELPLTPSGKVDRKGLPAPDQGRLERKNAYRAPRTTTEQALAVIWGEVLKLDRMGVQDNFFDLGGHSLLATQVVSRIRSTLSIELPLQRMFASPTIAEIATILDQNQVAHANDTQLAQTLGAVEVMTDIEVQKITEV